jgi:hypothetical protein
MHAPMSTQVCVCACVRTCTHTHTHTHRNHYHHNDQNVLLLFSTTHRSLLRLIVRSGLDVPTFATRRLHTSPCESTQQWQVEMWVKNVRKFCLNVDFHVTFRDLLNAVKLRHGTDGFTSPPKEGVLRIFLP